MALHEQHDEPVAVVGWACRFPGESTTPSKLWDLLKEPRDVRRGFDPQTLNLARFYSQNSETHGATNVTNQGYLLAEDSRLFDPSFFGISPAEAEGMDPQQRILLETVYETLEAAGYSLDQIRGSKTSVHVGVMTGDYADIQMRDTETVPQYTATGTGRSILSNRVSYIFDLHGPSVTVDTACSSSLVAVHLAIQAMQAGDCEAAVVGGVNLIFDPSMYIIESKLHMLSPDSQSRMWDKDANGYARGEGAAAVLLKPLSRALQDNDYIHGVIRATAVNSDGHSQGITMPRVSTQAALIRDTYHRAGLDPIKDRCQYFECHGTGTPAGDPVEARAIYEALIETPGSSDDAASQLEPENDEPLYVGSIKTVVGHLEGCAGLAGLVKVLLAINHRTILPNMLFNNLNEEIRPFASRLQIPTTALPWPKVQPGAALRASVNSFGFGGTNAHAILESYEQPAQASSAEIDDGEANTDNGDNPIGPFLFSAHSSLSLLGNVKAMLQHLEDHPNTNLDELAWVLHSRRSAHRVKQYFVADTRRKLIDSLKKYVLDSEGASKTEDLGIRPPLINPSEIPGILGVFTGQGAQWPTMGRGLLERSVLFRESLEECDAALQSLPDAPAWSLVDEVRADDSTSRVSEAAICQPLCTAIQVALVDLLYASGIRFAAVVGHSSGEIAAVYACGIISLRAAMQIAFYRGKYAALARGAQGQAGGMLAVGITLEQAEQFCAQGDYQGQIAVAASNGPQSVTLSGDLDAVQRAKEDFDRQGTFARLLKVDTAYHSHHMERCADLYLESLTSCNIEVHPPQHDCVWNSSVRGDTELLNGDLQSLKGPYWVQNMVNTVLFSQAVKSAIWHGGPFDLAIEIGPHPALKGPTEQTLRSAFGAPPFYTGVLQRGGSDIQAFSGSLGFCWSRLGPSFVDFKGYRLAFNHRRPKPSILNGLPAYAWDHDRVYWRESRISKRFRTTLDRSQELLGRRVADDTDRAMRWRNVLKLSELPWVRGHEILGQPLLPGASYVSIALEAGKRMARDRPIRLLEVRDLDIRRPVVVPSTKDGIETTFTTHLRDTNDPNIIEADFSYAYCPDEQVGSMVHTCSGRLLVFLGSTTKDELPGQGPEPLGLLPVSVDDMYRVLSDAGLSYSAMFRRLEHCQRTLGYACSTGCWKAEEFTDEYVAHPAIIDVCFQNLFLARSSPDTGHLPSTPLPVHIERLAMDPNVQWADDESGNICLKFESFITEQDGPSLSGDLHLYSASSFGRAILQVEGLSVKPVSEPTEQQDRTIFSEVSFEADPSWGLVEPTRNAQHDESEMRLAVDVDRVALYYVQRLLRAVDPVERAGLAWYHQRMFEAFEGMLQVVRSGAHPLVHKEWLSDSPEVLEALFEKHPDAIDLVACRLVGENMVSVVRGEIQLLELLMRDNVLSRVYMEACGWLIVSEALAKVAQQLLHKFPRADILEIGAGTGGSTWTVCEAIRGVMGTYTYTDISTGFFEAAAAKFANYKHKMIFKPLDIGDDVASQGLREHAYDIVIATNVLHATPSIATTLKNTRSLLKPGGYLLLIETTGLQVMRTPFIMAGMPGWYLGADDGRRLHPGITTEDWHCRLQETGFSGVDMVYYDSPEYEKHQVSLMVSQAVNETVMQLREPLSYPEAFPRNGSLLIIGGETLPVSKVVGAIQRLIPSARNLHVKTAANIEAVDVSRLSGLNDVICLQELNRPLFSTAITDKRLSSLQSIFLHARNVLWVTRNRRSGNPRANMMLGIARGLFQELPQVNIQMMDLEAIDPPSTSARTVLEAYMRLIISSAHRRDHDKLLWAREPELMARGDQMLIPRITPDQEINDRYNSIYRSVTKSVTADTDLVVEVAIRQKKLVLVEAHHPYSDSEKGTSTVKVDYSLYSTSQDSDCFCISVGHIMHSDTAVLTFSQKNASVLRVPHGKMIRIDEKDCNPITLYAVATQLLAEEAARRITSTEFVLFYGVSESLSSIISAEFQRIGKEALFACSGDSVPPGWIHVHPQSSVRALRCLVPHNVGLYVDFSNPSQLHIASLRPALPSRCRVMNSTLSFELPTGSLFNSYSRVRDLIPSVKMSADIVNVQDLSSTDVTDINHPFVISWDTTNSLTLTVQPADQPDLFDPRRTYLMAGMAGGLGLSICAWALQHGAKRLVITSRSPDIPPQWLRQARLQGAEIHVHKMDVTNRASVQAVIDLIKKTLPPIAGVCNAAMVLRDKLFVEMDAESVNDCLQPKVEGSQNLHDVFADTPLDFFILLGSGATIIGNPGQCNYHAANEFMVGLAAMRRQQGLAASVIHIGAVTDVGYVTRQSHGVKAAFQSLQIPFISQSDVHYAFAEAVHAGRPNSIRCFEFIVGIGGVKKELQPDEYPAWLTDPRCSHLTPSATVQEEVRLNSSSQRNIKQAIGANTTEDEAVLIIQEACSAKLESMMQLPAGSVDAHLSLIDLGIDSLVAVEVRTWFLKELGTDIPVLKMLGGDSVAQICTTAAKQVLASRMDLERERSSEGETDEDSPDDTASPGQRYSSQASSTAEDTPDTGISSAGSEADMKLDPEMEPPAASPDEDMGVDDPGRNVIQEAKASGAQSRIWSLLKYLKDPTAYNLMFSFEVHGHLDIGRLKSALKITMHHHESLRTCFYARYEDSHPMQGILVSPVCRFEHILDATNQQIAAEMDALKTKNWDIENGETLGVTVLSRTLQEHVILFAYHHIIMDAASWRVFLEDLNLAYQLRPLKSRNRSYIEYTMRQQRGEETGFFQSQLQYWQQEYSSLPQVLPLMPVARTRMRPSEQTFKTHYAWREVDASVLLRVRSACQALRITAFHFHLAVIQVLLARSLGIQDISIGVADANRVDNDFAETVGFFMNLLPVRFEVAEDSSFSQVARNTAQKVLAALDNSAVPFNMILDGLKVPRSSSHTPLFQVAVNYRNGSVKEAPLGDSLMIMTDAQDARNPYDMSFGIVDTGLAGSRVEVTFQEALFDPPACHAILDTYMRLLETFALDSESLVKECAVHNPEDVSKALELGRGPQIRFDWPPTLSERILDMCQIHAEKPAIEEGPDILTYSGLKTRIISVAAALDGAGFGSGSRIALLCEPSADSVVSLLAILHVGAIYVPLDVSLPSARHELIVQDSEPSLLLCHAATSALADSLALKYGLPIRCVDEVDEASVSIPCAARQSAPAIILYTSGSTGKPKGVLLSQANFANHVALLAEALGLVQGCESVLQQSSLGFDMSLIQIFSSLANGGTLVIAPQEARRDPVEITQLMLQHHVTLTIATPSEYTTWLQFGSGFLHRCESWCHACMGGETAPDYLKREFKRLEIPALTLTNWYGPTEITAAATFSTVSLDSKDETDAQSTIGRALSNYSVRILDPQGRPLPVGFRGEICIGGAGVALGYHNLPAETARKFIQSNDGADRLYLTGDMGRLNPDGTLAFMGRLDGDTQIKLRGIRIELADVEAALLAASLGSFLNAIVTVRADYLVAHAVLAPGSVFGDDDAQNILSRLPLPQYMHPAVIITVDRLPVTSNGKIDRKAVGSLPLPANAGISPLDAKLSLREGELRLLWDQVLVKKRNLTAESDFFLKGGNSIQLIKLQHSIKQEMGVSVATRDLYQTSTLRRMAALIDAHREIQVPTEADINWEEETAFTSTTTSSCQKAIAGKRRHDDGAGIQVLMTGATGFLGRATLEALIQNPSVSVIHCVAVLPDEQTQLPESDKVVCYTGSLSSPTLGLSQDECDQLRFCIDVILHAGARGHCLNNYASVRDPNVKSTRFLASLAMATSIPFLYLSTNRVPLLSGKTSMPPVSMASYPPPTTGTEGFTASKWASECYLEKLARHTDIPVEVHRPCVTIGDHAPNSDALNAIFRYSLLMKSVPKYANMQGYFDFKNVEDVASELASAAAALAEQPVQHGEDATTATVGIRFYHHSSRVKVPMDNIKGYLEKLYKCPFEQLEIHDWIQRAVEAGMDTLIATYLGSLIEGGNTLSFSYLGEGGDEK
ncbi:putative polyketide synthase [Aspergillus unguis]